MPGSSVPVRVMPKHVIVLRQLNKRKRGGINSVKERAETVRKREGEGGGVKQ